MGKKQTALEEMLATVGAVTKKRCAVLKASHLAQSPLHSSLVGVYQRLGGVLTTLPCNLKAWDLEFEGSAVELDEELHFNRYRGATLESPLYARLPLFPVTDYREYCSVHESDCLRACSHDGKWTKEPAEKQFGPAGERGRLEGQGAPRWKQRAYYDFVKDFAPLLIGVQVVRVSIWDVVSERGTRRRVRDVLEKPGAGSADAIAELIRARTSPSTQP